MNDLPERYRRIPPPLKNGQHRDFPLSHYVHQHALALEEGRTDLICGFKLPPFQRPFVWTAEQQVRFIESCWLELDIGRFVVTQDTNSAEWDQLIIDGQQRLTTLQRYLRDAFPVFGLYWKDLTREERRRLDRVSASTLVLSGPLDEVFLREWYNRLNFGGTAHQNNQRA